MTEAELGPLEALYESPALARSELTPPLGRLYGGGLGFAGPTVYANFVASGAHRLEFDVDRLVVDDDCILTEGTMRIAYPGNLLRFMGHEVDDPDAFYLFQTRMAVVWPMDADGLVIGEDTYTAGDGFVGIAGRKVRAEDLAA